MSEVGRVSENQKGDLSGLSGYINTPALNVKIVIVGDPKRVDDRTPSHRIYMKNHDGARGPEVGSAWLKTAKNGPSAGKNFFSLTIDFPGFETPLNVAAFKDDKAGDWSIVWRRRQTKPVTA